MTKTVDLSDVVEQLKNAGYYEAARFVLQTYGPARCRYCRGTGSVQGSEYPNHAFIYKCSACNGKGVRS